MKKIITLLLISLCLLVTIPSNIISADNNEIHIKNVDEWNDLAKKCQVDSYSNNLTIILDNDIYFNNNFNSIPYFNGTFDGNSHSINNVSINSSLTNDGIFRITGKKSIIKNVIVDMNTINDASRIGVVGYNQGLIENINVSSTIDGDDEAGLIAGYNSVSGVIKNCISHGSINAIHQVGGIVGTNYGYISNCTNNTNVNNEVEKEDLDISTLTIESLTDSSVMSKLNDVGGIVGLNYGIVENCTNHGTIGHEHVGYNIGGIVGCQSGYVNNCVNHGLVQGRKEIGGIVGQAEPSMSLIFQEDYLQLMKRQIKSIYNDTNTIIEELRDIKETNISYFNSINNNLNEAYDALDLMLNNKPRESDFDAGKVALSAALKKVLDTSKSLVEYNSDSDDLYDKLNEVAKEISELSTTTVNFADSLSTEKDMYVDVSNKDNDNNKTGKISKCTNYANIIGDINVGGIVGSMALENDLNPEDDLEIIGKKSFDARYETKDVINSCINYGSINIKRNYAGGICGNQTTGLINNSINYGLLDCEEGNYIGGVVGKSVSNINSNYSKCFIYGNNYVGGIAGSGIKAKDNGSLVQILSYNSNVGSIFGNYGKIDDEIVDKADEIINNWYVYDDIAAIDGISYDKKAFLISDEEMLNKKINDDLKKINIVFIKNNEVFYKKSIEYGDSFFESNYPYIIKSDNSYNWECINDANFNHLTKDALIVSNYHDLLPSISSNENPIAYIILNGKFNDQDKVNNTIINNNETEISYSINSTLSEDSYIDTYCIYTNNFNNYNILSLKGNEWKKVNYEKDGRYAIINSIDVNNQIRVVKVNDYSATIICFASAGIIITLICLISKNKNKKKK